MAPIDRNLPDFDFPFPSYDKQNQWLLTVFEGDDGKLTVRISDKSRNGINPDWPAPYPCAELGIEEFAAYMEPESFWRDHKHTLGLHGLNPDLPEGLHDYVSKKDVRSMQAWASETLDRYRQMNQENKQKGDIQMDIQNQPKERIVYDEDVYDEDFLREQLEERYVTFGDMDELNDDFVNENWFLLDDYRQTDYDEEIGDLTAFFDGGERMMSSFDNPLAGNPVIVSGVIGRWDGERRGFSPFKNLKDALDTSPSRFGLGNPLADCEIQKVWDENGHLFVHGTHHDGSVTVEVRQLTDDGAAALEAIEDAWVGEPFTAGGKSYDGSMQSINQAMRDLWGTPALCPAPRYMEQCFGCPAEEWRLDPLPIERIGFEEEISEVGDLLNFYIPVTFDVDRVFGTDVQSLDNDDWLNLYANYDIEHGVVSDRLELSLNRADGSIDYLTYPLDAGQREALHQKMDAYCKEQVGKSLDEYAKELVQPEATEMKTPEVSAGRSIGKATASVSLSSAAAESRAASQALAGDDGHENRVQDAR